MTRVLIVGGGITGLSAAFYLQQKAPELQITLLEQSGRLGGKIQTERSGGLIMELGPDSMLARKQAIVDLIHELELENEVVGTNPSARKNYIYRKHKLHEMPKGLNLGIPTQVLPFVQSDLISPIGERGCGKHSGTAAVGHLCRGYKPAEPASHFSAVSTARTELWQRDQRDGG